MEDVSAEFISKMTSYLNQTLGVALPLEEIRMELGRLKSEDALTDDIKNVYQKYYPLVTDAVYYRCFSTSRADGTVYSSMMRASDTIEAYDILFARLFPKRKLLEYIYRGGNSTKHLKKTAKDEYKEYIQIYAVDDNYQRYSLTTKYEEYQDNKDPETLKRLGLIYSVLRDRTAMVIPFRQKRENVKTLKMIQKAMKKQHPEIKKADKYFRAVGLAMGERSVHFSEFLKLRNESERMLLNDYLENDPEFERAAEGVMESIRERKIYHHPLNDLTDDKINEIIIRKEFPVMKEEKKKESETSGRKRMEVSDSLTKIDMKSVGKEKK